MPAPARLPWLMLLCAAAIILITTGVRQTVGLFIAPLDAANGLGIVSISLAIAVGQLMWGLAQPGFGMLADRYGALPALVLGGILIALGLVLTPLAGSELALIVTLGVLSGAGAGAGSFSVLIGGSARHLRPEQRGLASGVISAGGSLGQVVFAPLTQVLITGLGWVHAMWALAAASLATLPLAWPLRQRGTGAAATSGESGLRAQLATAFRDASFLWILAGFFTCGFHISFLVTHLPGEVRLCGLSAQTAANTIGLIGLANVIGTIGVGWLSGRCRMKYLLFWLYASRTAVILAYLAAPKTELTFYLFGFALGLSWLATVPPTAGLIGKLFGVRYLATLVGIAMLSHQIGGFLGAWLGGLAMARYGDYSWMFLADALLALFAAVAALPVREARLARPAAA